MEHPDNDQVCNTSNNRHFADVLSAQMQRRSFLQGGILAAASALCGGMVFLPTHTASAGGSGLGFMPISTSLADLVRVPEGYVVEILYAWGDPVGALSQTPGAPAFLPDASNTAAEQEFQAGMHHDGLHFFPFPLRGIGKPNAVSSTRGLLCINHEYTDDGLLHVGGQTPWTPEKVRKSQAAHGVSIIEIRQQPRGNWTVVRPSPFARRITAYTPMRIAGPAAGDPLLQTAADPTGSTVLGTLNNCAHGFTPWGTYLTCEENWNGYFVNPTGDVLGVPDVDQKLLLLGGQSRYGITRTGFGYRWHEHDGRFDASQHPHEPHRFGWVVEIDPFQPHSQPVKRTALGRFKHEGATVTLARDGRVVVYMGDDERNEYIYKFVSRHPFEARSRAANQSLLDDGTLYVAQFHDDNRGEWLELSFGQNGLIPENGFTSQADILIQTRQAADYVGATMMDRPEWIAVHPTTKEVYVTLTNNSRRGTTPPSSNNPDGTTAAGSARPPTDAANPRADNIYGHIVRWREAGDDPAALTFTWDVFVFCGDPDDPGRNLGSSPDPRPHYVGDIQGDIFGSPDGLWFDAAGRLWIQTDISTSIVGFPAGTGDPAKEAYVNIGNNQMLCADPVSREIRRFLTGPQKCEVTGVVSTPDQKTMFVNIQHPGETSSERSDPANPTALSHWPFTQGYGPSGRPRSATIVIRRRDGGIIGER
ncbi:MAG: PhoX family phosphatase [Candidatus Tectimicrobiota bacterium]